MVPVVACEGEGGMWGVFKGKTQRDLSGSSLFLNLDGGYMDVFSSIIIL